MTPIDAQLRDWIKSRTMTAVEVLDQRFVKGFAGIKFRDHEAFFRLISSW